MALKSTHSGHCQLCGHFQKLPGNRLSLHGYTVEWGFFSGTCPGSRDEPYELSCDAIKRRIPGVKAEIAELEQSILEIESQRAVVFFHEHVPATFRRGERQSRYVWRELPLDSIKTERVEWSKHVFAKAYLTPEGGRTQATESESGTTEAEAIEALIVAQNGRRSKFVRGYLEQVRSYLAWCEKRVAAWKLSPLTPNKADEEPLEKLIVAGTVVKLWGREIEVLRVEPRVARGVGPYLNGHTMPHIVFAAKTGGEHAYPVRLIRRASIVKAAA